MINKVRERKHKPVYKQTWEIMLYHHHHSGIGSVYERTIIVDVKPTYDDSWFDVTNSKWARWTDTKGNQAI